MRFGNFLQSTVGTLGLATLVSNSKQEQESLQVLLQVVLQFAPVILSGSTAKQLIYGDTIGLATLVLQQEDKYKEY